MDNIILTAYFTTKKDPQRNVFWGSNDYSIIKNWYESIVRLGLHGIIFHDSLSQEFIEKYSNDNVKFIPFTLGQMSTNDERYFCFYHYLKNNRYDHIVMTDLSDVEIMRDPFEFVAGDSQIYSGRDEERYTTSYFHDTRLEYFPIDRGRILANCGAIGGKYDNIMMMLESMVSLLEKYKDKEYRLTDMQVFNHFLYTLFDNVHVGYPFTSKFKKYEKEGNFYIRHK